MILLLLNEVKNTSPSSKNHIPEIRIRFLKGQMKHRTYTKNITTCTSNLLKIIGKSRVVFFEELVVIQVGNGTLSKHGVVRIRMSACLASWKASS